MVQTDGKNHRASKRLRGDQAAPEEEEEKGNFVVKRTANPTTNINSENTILHAVHFFRVKRGDLRLLNNAAHQKELGKTKKILQTKQKREKAEKNLQEEKEMITIIPHQTFVTVGGRGINMLKFTKKSPKGKLSLEFLRESYLRRQQRGERAEGKKKLFPISMDAQRWLDKKIKSSEKKKKQKLTEEEEEENDVFCDSLSIQPLKFIRVTPKILKLTKKRPGNWKSLRSEYKKVMKNKKNL